MSDRSPAPGFPTLSAPGIRDWIAHHVPAADFAGQRVLLIIPDNTRTAPLPALFAGLFETIAPVAQSLDVMVALGTHRAMPEADIAQLLGMSPADRAGRYARIKLLNHEWDNPAALYRLGWLDEAETAEISSGLMRERVPVDINRAILDYDLLLVCGPTFPHEVVGFSGGNKYFFPGIAGPEILNFFHWLGALITNYGIIGVKQTPVRAVVDKAAALIPVQRRCLSFVVKSADEVYGLAYGSPESAWSRAADLSGQVHITRKPKPFNTVLSCAPLMYDELWVAGKCMYKLEPVVADDGELIIYAPHLHEISLTHGAAIREVGYHVRDYFLKQWDRFTHIPRGVLAHSTHVRGVGSFENGIERPRVRVTLASQVPPAECAAINLGYRDPASIDVESFANREDEGVLLVRKAGEMLYRLESDPT